MGGGGGGSACEGKAKDSRMVVNSLGNYKDTRLMNMVGGRGGGED